MPFATWSVRMTGGSVRTRNPLPAGLQAKEPHSQGLGSFCGEGILTKETVNARPGPPYAADCRLGRALEKEGTFSNEIKRVSGHPHSPVTPPALPEHR